MLSVVALVSGLPLAHALAAGTTVQLTPATQAIAIGETTTVTWYVQDVQDLYGYQVEIAFDPAVLEVVDADTATTDIQVALGSWLQPDFVFRNNADNSAGTIVCVLSQLSPRPAVSGSGELLTITFRGLATGVSPVRFTDLTMANLDGIMIPVVSQQDAQIEVSGGTPPATPTPTPTLPPASGTVLTLRNFDAGAQTIVEVWVENVEDFYSVDVSLAFDAAIVQGMSVVKGPAFTDYPSQCVVSQSSIANGVVQFAGTMVCISQDGDLHLATITFEDLSCGTSPLTWQSTLLTDSTASPIPHTAQDGSVTPWECPAEVNGQALLEGRTDHSGVDVSLVDGTSQSMLTGANGAYGFVDVIPDVYNLAVSHELYLSAALTCTIPPGETVWMPDITLLGGDLNGDDVIDISDLTIGGSLFNTTNPEADVNGSGYVDIYDIVLVGKNFGLTGPVVYSCP